MVVRRVRSTLPAIQKRAETKVIWAGSSASRFTADATSLKWVPGRARCGDASKAQHQDSVAVPVWHPYFNNRRRDLLSNNEASREFPRRFAQHRARGAH